MTVKVVTISTRAALLATSVLLGTAGGGTTAHAQDAAARIGAIEGQIRALQEELRKVKRDLVQRGEQVRAAQREAAAARAEVRRAPPPALATPAPGLQLGQAAPPAPAAPAAPAAASGQAAEQPVTVVAGKLGQFRIGAVTVQLGGFVEAAGIFRSRNEVADIASNWNAIPFPINPQYGESETRFSARQSRVSLLMEAEPRGTPHKLTAYGEADFLGAAPTANSNESNSYNLRLRHAFAMYENKDWNLQVLGGQAWSLLTLNRSGILPRQELPPLTIDAQYVPGFTWARQPQFRVAANFDQHRLWLAASVENPQTSFYVGPNGTGTIVGSTSVNNPGGSNFAPTVNYSFDAGPDVIVKAAYDPGFGHFEVYGLARFFRSRVTSGGRGGNDTVVAGGGGAAMILPIVPKYLDLQASFLAGTGIGRYGSGQLPDATLSRGGSPEPLPEVQALVGLIGHPIPQIDIYGYVGTEQIGRRNFAAGGRGFGYGSPLYSNAGCQIELSALPCTANTSGLVQGTVGAWWRFLQGNYGTMHAGAQYSHTERSVFGGVGGSPSTDDDIVLLSFRYAPFQ